jgi:hypothetical protein
MGIELNLCIFYEIMLKTIILDQQKITIFIVQCCLQVFWIICRFIDPNHHINIILHPIYITEVTNGVALKNLRKTTPPILFIWAFNNVSQTQNNLLDISQPNS